MKTFNTAALVCILGLQPAAFASADGDVELVETMATLQYFAHKTALAIDKKNKPLAEFYAHELEEFLEEAAEVESYDGHPVSKMVESLAMPTFEKFESALKTGKWDQISDRFDDVVSSCNSCHQATEHGFITIERQKHNPFMQSFRPAK